MLNRFFHGVLASGTMPLLHVLGGTQPGSLLACTLPLILQQAEILRFILAQVGTLPLLLILGGILSFIDSSVRAAVILQLSEMLRPFYNRK